MYVVKGLLSDDAPAPRSNMLHDWKRRYFILDSRGLLYYYRSLDGPLPAAAAAVAATVEAASHPFGNGTGALPLTPEGVACMPSTPNNWGGLFRYVLDVCR
jgi:hypothetical protein